MDTKTAAQGKWEEIYSHYGIAIRHNKHQECPICGRKGTSGIRIHDKDGHGQWVCVCGSGGGISLLMEVTGLPFAQVAKDIDKIIGNDHTKKVQPKLSGVIRKTQATLKPIHNEWSEYYLRNRGIEHLPTMSINHCDAVPLFDETGKKTGVHPTMVAIVTDALTIEPLQQHITYLDGANKITRKVRNLTDVDFKMPIVRLMDAEQTLGIAEGIETALSAHDKYSIPCWSTINSGFMKRFRAPAGVTELWIFADNDKSATGHAAAFECARANLNAKNDVSTVFVLWPNEYGDFNDLEDKDNFTHVEFNK